MNREGIALAGCLPDLLGPGFAIVCQAVQSSPHGLFPEEMKYMRSVAPKRGAEFGTARMCARDALSQLGFGPMPLMPQADRSPWWPPGVRGSISHAGGYCIVAVTGDPDVLGVGLDLEPDIPLQQNMEHLICTGHEAESMRGAGEMARGRLAKLYFSAKEAFYKCQYPITQSRLGFQDVELSIDACLGRFSVQRICRSGSAWEGLRRVQGRFAWTEGFVVTAAVLRRDP